MLGNLEHYEEIPQNLLKYSLMDTFILAKLEQVKNAAIDAYNHYDFATVTSQIITFLSGDLSSFYLDFAKDILYCDEIESPRRKAVVDVIFRCCHDLCLLLNPILPFTMEEVYGYLPGQKKKFVQLENMPKASYEYGEETLSLYDAFKELRTVALKTLEESRARGEFGSSSDASLSLVVKNRKLQQLLEREGENAAKFFMVADLKLSGGEENKATSTLADGEECPRCRCKVRQLETIGEEQVCHRCALALKEAGK